MARQLSEQAQVAKILKEKAKELGLEVKASSQSFSMGNSVKIKVLSGTDDSLAKLKDYSRKYESGHFDGMTDMYEYSNSRDDIPQTKYLFVNDDRLDQIIDDYYEGSPNDFYSLKFSQNGVDGSQHKFFQKLRELAGENWTEYAAEMIKALGKWKKASREIEGWTLSIYKES